MNEDETIPYNVDELQRELGLNQGYSPEEVAQALGVNMSTVYRWLQSGKLKGKQFGKQWRITSTNVSDLVEAQERERQRFIDAKIELRLAKKIKKDRDWSIETCVICEGPIVTDGGETATGQSVIMYGPEGQKLLACAWPFQCQLRLKAMLRRKPSEATEASESPFEPEDIPFE